MRYEISSHSTLLEAAVSQIHSPQYLFTASCQDGNCVKPFSFNAAKFIRLFCGRFAFVGNSSLDTG
jgi:hypothetical protein